MAKRTIELEVPEDLVTVLTEAYPGVPPERAALETIVLELYRRRLISSGKAAELLALPRVDFIVYSGELGIAFFDMSEEEWQAELRAVHEIVNSRSSLPTPAR